jgi:hypothetical protein
MLAPDQFYPDNRCSTGITFDTRDSEQARTLRILEEADASGAFGPDGFRCCELGPELYTVAFYPGGALDMLEHKPVAGARETT